MYGVLCNERPDTKGKRSIMSKKFDEYSEKAADIMDKVEMFMKYIIDRQGVSFKDPPHDTARRFLHEIEEFEMVGE